MKTLMLVDDDEQVRSSMGELLRQLGFSVLLMQDGASALTALQGTAKVDCFILDYQMPGMDGLELLAAIKGKAPDIPVIMITGYGDIESYLKAVGLSASENLDKPVRLRELQRVVRAAMNASSEM